MLGKRERHYASPHQFTYLTYRANKLVLSRNISPLRQGHINEGGIDDEKEKGRHVERENHCANKYDKGG